jgi:hypothetical protein
MNDLFFKYIKILVVGVCLLFYVFAAVPFFTEPETLRNPPKMAEYLWQAYFMGWLVTVFGLFLLSASALMGEGVLKCERIGAVAITNVTLLLLIVSLAYSARHGSPAAQLSAAWVMGLFACGIVWTSLKKKLLRGSLVILSVYVVYFLSGLLLAESFKELAQPGHSLAFSTPLLRDPFLFLQDKSNLMGMAGFTGFSLLLAITALASRLTDTEKIEFEGKRVKQFRDIAKSKEDTLKGLEVVKLVDSIKPPPPPGGGGGGPPGGGGGQPQQNPMQAAIDKTLTEFFDKKIKPELDKIRTEAKGGGGPPGGGGQGGGGGQAGGGQGGGGQGGGNAPPKG